MARDHLFVIESSQTNMEQFLNERAIRAGLLQRLCADYYSDNGNLEVCWQNMSRELKIDDSNMADTVRFMLESFRPGQENIVPRKDGTYIAVHSLELYRKAQELGMNDLILLQTVLLHDVLEDSGRTVNDIELLNPQIVPFAVTMKEERLEGCSREEVLIAFVEQLRLSPAVPEDEKFIIVLAECLDRIDDLSNLGYLTDQSSGMSLAEITSKLAKKFAKCRYTIDRLTIGHARPEVQRLRDIFDKLYFHHLESFDKKYSGFSSQIVKYLESLQRISLLKFPV